MLVVADFDRLVDQQHRDTVFDAVSAPHPRVVQHISDQEQRASIGRANQNAQQGFVNHLGLDRYCPLDISARAAPVNRRN